MTNDGKLFTDEITNLLMDESGLKQSKYKMSVYYRCAPDGSRLVVFSCVDNCLYWYKYDELGNCFLGALGKRLHINVLGYAHMFMSIRISQLWAHYILVYQDIFATYNVANYLDTATIK